MTGNFQIDVAGVLCHVNYTVNPTTEQLADFDMIFHTDGTCNVNGKSNIDTVDLTPLHRTIYSRVLEQQGVVPKSIGVKIT